MAALPQTSPAAELRTTRRLTPRGERALSTQEVAEMARRELQAFLEQSSRLPRSQLPQRFRQLLPIPRQLEDDRALANVSPSRPSILDVHDIHNPLESGSLLLQLRHTPRKPRPLAKNSSPCTLQRLITDKSAEWVASTDVVASPRPQALSAQKELHQSKLKFRGRPESNTSQISTAHAVVAPSASEEHQVKAAPLQCILQGAATSSGDSEAQAAFDTTWVVFPPPVPPPVELSTTSEKGGIDPNLMRSLSRIKFLRGLSPIALEQVGRLGRVREYPRYSSLAKEGLMSGTFFGLIFGKLMAASTRRRSSVDETAPRKLHAELGDNFGEDCLVNESLREESIGALTDVRVFVLTRAELLRAPSGVLKELRMTSQWAVAQKTAVLKLIPGLLYWGQLDARRQDAIAGMLEVIHVDAGTTIFYEGSTVDVTGPDATSRFFYIFLDGHIRMSRLAKDKPPIDYTPESTGNDGGMGLVRPWFGEYALWFSKPRNATAVALAPSRLLGMHSSHFAAFLELVPDFLSSSSFAAGRRRSLANTFLKAGTVSNESVGVVAAAALRWASQGGLRSGAGCTGLQAHKIRARLSVFAERWERMVCAMLLSSAARGANWESRHRVRSQRTFSLRVEDFNNHPSRVECS